MVNSSTEVKFSLQTWPDGFDKKVLKEKCKEKFKTVDEFTKDITPKARWHEWALNFTHNDPTGTCQMMLATKQFFKQVCIRASGLKMSLTDIFKENFSEKDQKNILAKTKRFQKNYTSTTDKPAKEVRAKDLDKAVEDSSWEKHFPEQHAEYTKLQEQFAKANSPEVLNEIYIDAAKLMDVVYKKLRALEVTTKDIYQDDRTFMYVDYRTAKVLYVKSIANNKEHCTEVVRQALEKSGVKNPVTLNKLGVKVV